MSKKLAYVSLVISFGLILTFQNCGQQTLPVQDAANGQPNRSNQAVSLNGTVQSLQLDGCGKVIVSNSDGKSTFIPQGADISQLAEGSQVHLEGQVATDVVSSCMAGVIVNVTSLKPVTK